ncbi:hypothetical protein PT974_07361 [Cladobotryum mycophilum]|uniref:Uncharacterized protein n=1 Tax=Cladobotryum mycophilum TaxID=491253 RepID=A0ABR0SP91_9HYPO
MGKPSDKLPVPSPSPSGPRTPLSQPSSAINLDTTPPENNSSGTRFHSAVDPLAPSGIRGLGLSIEPFAHDARSDIVYYINEDLETDPSFLENTLNTLSKMPPRPFAVIRGTHTETRRNNDDDREENRQVVDFDLEIEMTHLLFTDIHNPQHGAWREIKTVGNFEKVKRGTVFATRAPGFGGSGTAESGEPSVQEWCHRFCASSAGLKNLSFERRVVGYDWDLLERRLEDLVRATNYRGRLDISFPIRNSRVEIYNSCRTNRWRLTKWIYIVSIITLMFLFTWPWLFFRTKRWQTVYAEWEVSREEDDGTGRVTRRYASMSEEAWYNLWAKAVQKAVLERKQGALDQGDLERARAYEAAAEDLTGSSPETASTSLAGTTHDLHLKTAYYTATVPVWLDLITSPSEWSESFLSEEAREVLAVLGGIVLVFAIPNAKPDTLTGQDDVPSLIRHVGQVVQKGLGGWEWDGVRLAVGIGEGEAEEWDELCAAAGLEFVQLGGSHQERNEFGAICHHETEKTGIPRVKEAFESNDWDQLDDVPQLSDFGDFEEASTKHDAEFDPESLDFGVDKTDFEGLRKAIWESGQGEDDAHNADDTKAKPAATSTDAGASKQSDSLDDGELDDEDVAKVEKMMRKLQAAKEMGEGMSEAQRKRLAARAVEEVMREL